MRLTRCQDQGSKTLEEFYGELNQSEQPVTREIGKTMLGLLGRLHALPVEWDVYGLISHERLCLLAEDDYESPWYLMVFALNEGNYFVEYLMPERVAPWPGAYVRGEARSEDDAVRMIMTAMNQSEGWSQKP